MLIFLLCINIEFEQNVLAADVNSFAESRLCKRDENVHFALKRFSLIRLDDTENESVNRPHHGLALYVKESFHVQKVVKLHCQSCECILANMHSIQKGYFQIVVLYRYPKSSRTDFKNDIRCCLRPMLDLPARLVILGDFNIQIDCVNAEFSFFLDLI